MKPDASNSLALGVLWLRTLSVFALAIFVYWRGGENLWLPLADLMGAALVLALWTPLMGKLLAGQPVLTTDARRRMLNVLYPWTIAYEGSLWLLWSLSALAGGFSPSHPLALAAMLTVLGASVAVNFLIYLYSLRLMTNPADSSGRGQLSDLMNLAAAIGAASVVLNVVPLGGQAPPTLADQVAYGLAGGVEVASWLLLRWAIRPNEAEVVKGGG